MWKIPLQALAAGWYMHLLLLTWHTSQGSQARLGEGGCESKAPMNTATIRGFAIELLPLSPVRLTASFEQKPAAAL